MPSRSRSRCRRAQHRFGSGPAVPSRGISSSYLGPVVRVRSGETIPFRVENHLDEETTLHWHGMLVPSHVDGGPHNTIRARRCLVSGDYDQAAAGDDLVPSPPARRHGAASLSRPRRHDDRQRRRRPRSRPACNLWRRRSADWCCRTSASAATASSSTSRP